MIKSAATIGRRRLYVLPAAGAAAWAKPVVRSALLPAHAAHHGAGLDAAPQRYYIAEHRSGGACWKFNIRENMARDDAFSISVSVRCADGHVARFSHPNLLDGGEPQPLLPAASAAGHSETMRLAFSLATRTLIVAFSAAAAVFVPVTRSDRPLRLDAPRKADRRPKQLRGAPPRALRQRHPQEKTFKRKP